MKQRFCAFCHFHVWDASYSFPFEKPPVSHSTVASSMFQSGPPSYSWPRQHKKIKRVSNGLAGQGTIRAFLRRQGRAVANQVS